MVSAWLALIPSYFPERMSLAFCQALRSLCEAHGEDGLTGFIGDLQGQTIPQHIGTQFDPQSLASQLTGVRFTQRFHCSLTSNRLSILGRAVFKAINRE